MDGEWQVCQDLPVVADAAGIKNNQLEVEAGGPGLRGQRKLGEGDQHISAALTVQASVPGGGERIAVVERIIRLDWAETEAALAACPGAQLLSEAEVSDIYWDIHDFSLLRSVSRV